MINAYVYSTLSTGFSAAVDVLLADVAKTSSCPEKDRWIILLMDEMHVKENLVFDKHTGMFERTTIL